ncbi:hypothetical protein [Streptomyces canus]|uniref:hypothetical protein n=1 Tax=Streptomyces canus TaxID=58343 RepID=UPI0036EC1E23
MNIFRPGLHPCTRYTKQCAEAADHGQAEIHQHTAEATCLIGKISRLRDDLQA